MAVSITSKSWWSAGVLVIIWAWFFFHSYTTSSRTTNIGDGLSLSPNETIRPGIICDGGVTCPGDVTSTPVSDNADTNFNNRPNGESQISNGNPNSKSENRPLILFVYYESDFARQNLQFFVDHGLHSAADFVFILNGKTDVAETVIFRQDGDDSTKRNRSNIMVKNRDNKCYDLGSHAEVLNGVLGGDGWVGDNGPIPLPGHESSVPHTPVDERALKDRYKRFILMNSSIRGPFVPLWSNACWSNAYLSKLSDNVKMVGMTYNCNNGKGHVQSMIWALDRVGLEVILSPAGIGECFADWWAAVDGEIRTTKLLRDHGYEVDVFLTVYHSKDKETNGKTLPKPKSADMTSEFDSSSENSKQDAGTTNAGRDLGTARTEEIRARKDTIPGDFWKTCTDEDYLHPGTYFGTFVHPYETLFMKSHRNIEDNVLDRLTEWHNGWGYSSYDVCS